MTIQYLRIQTRRDTSINWQTANPVLLSGEVGYETDTGRTKTGNGSSAWGLLSYDVDGIVSTREEDFTVDQGELQWTYDLTQDLGDVGEQTVKEYVDAQDATHTDAIELNASKIETLNSPADVAGSVSHTVMIGVAAETVRATDAEYNLGLRITQETVRATAAEDAIQADVDQNEADSDSADAALGVRIDGVETNLAAEETRATAAEAAIQADVDQNEADSDAAIAAVQADVDQNELDSDAADAALSGRLDDLEADPTTATNLAEGLALKANLAGADFTGVVKAVGKTGNITRVVTSQDIEDFDGFNGDGSLTASMFIGLGEGSGIRGDVYNIPGDTLVVDSKNSIFKGVANSAQAAAVGSALESAINSKANSADLGTAATTASTDYATSAQGALADTALQDATAFASAAQGDLADTALQDATAFASAAQGALADTALQDANAFASAAQGLLADSALQSNDIGLTVQAYDVGTVVDPDYATVKAENATTKVTADTAVQPALDAITALTIPTDGSETTAQIAAALNNLAAEVAALLNT